MFSRSILVAITLLLSFGALSAPANAAGCFLMNIYGSTSTAKCGKTDVPALNEIYQPEEPPKVAAIPLRKRSIKADIGLENFVLTSLSPDEKAVTILNKNTNGENGSIGAIHIRCSSNKTSLLFEFPGNNMSDKGRLSEILYTLDAGEKKNLELDLSTDKSILGVWEGYRSVPFLKKMIGHEKFAMNAIAADGKSISMEFNITGLDQAIGDIRRSCHW